MSYFPDLGNESMVAGGDHIRAIGWLHPDHPYTQGKVAAKFLRRLKAFVAQSSDSAEALYFAASMGYHGCEFCGKAHGIENFGVPADDILFVAPEMIVHYVEQHGYCPPPQFIDAVMKSPLPKSDEYQVLTEPFWHLHSGAIRRRVQAAEEDLRENKGVLWREVRDDV